jgi:hypothetical protein
MYQEGISCATEFIGRYEFIDSVCQLASLYDCRSLRRTSSQLRVQDKTVLIVITVESRKKSLST